MPVNTEINQLWSILRVSSVLMEEKLGIYVENEVPSCSHGHLSYRYVCVLFCVEARGVTSFAGARGRVHVQNRANFE